MSLIDSTYFVMDINIPTSTYNSVTAYINRFEPEILKKILGYDLYKLVAAYANPGSDQRIIDLVEGKEYAYDSDHNVKWNGLANTDKISLIAYYVYFKYVAINTTSLMPVGNTAATGENGVRADASQKLHGAWVAMRELIGYPGQDALAPSLYNFLSFYDSTYPEWEFTDIGQINPFDL